MSTSISSLSTGNFGLIQQLAADSNVTSQKLAQLTIQSQSGYVASTYAGLESAQPGSASQTLVLNSSIDTLNNTISNLQVAQGQMSVQQSAIQTISDIASKALTQFEGVNSLSGSALSTAAATARSAVTQIASLLNSQDGTRYIFAGQDSTIPPVPNATSFTSAAFYVSIQSATSTLSVSGVFSAASSAANSPFSSTLASNPGVPSVLGAGGVPISTGIAANSNQFIGPSTGTNTTGSYMKDILTTLSAIGSLQPSQLSSSNFESFANTISASLGNAINTMAQDAGALGNNQALVNTQIADLQQTSNALTNQVAGFDQVNMTKTLSQLSATQTQLQASYQLIAAVKTMSLTQYI
jgi:flagellar hook-associated protein 3 FlgL